MSNQRMDWMPFYRQLLRLFPRAFRQRFEQEMLLTLQDAFNSEPSINPRVYQFPKTLKVVSDILASIIHEHGLVWRYEMRATRIIQGIGIAAIGAWLALWGWFIGKWVLLLPISDPTGWLLDKEYQNVAMNIFGAVMFLIPFLSLLTFIVPALKIQFSRQGGDGVMSIRLQKMSKSQALISWTCLLITLAWWGVLFISRMGWT